MEAFELAATVREGAGRSVCNALHRAGQVPAVVYGGGSAATGLAIELREFERLLRQIGGVGALVQLNIAGSAPVLAKVKEIQRRPATRAVLHVDFQTLAASA
ncbi:MAG: hypothetical protein IT204_02695 [Fimbriimonadaceae bacterium]|nr:hypothetical protein [Fimbriimonadaceae bacterium]